MHINIQREGAKRMERDPFQWCPVMDEEVMGANWHNRPCVNARKQVWPSTGTGCPGRLWSLHPWRYWKTVWGNWFYVALLEQGGWVSWFPEVSFHLIHTVNQSVNDFYKLTSSLFITETSFWYDLRVFIRDTGVISWTHSSTQVLHHLDLSARTEEWNI